MKRFVPAVLLSCVVALTYAVPVGAVAVLAPATAPTDATLDFTFTLTNPTASPTTEVTVTFPKTPTIKTVNATAPSGWTSTAYAEPGYVTGVTFSAGTLAPGSTGDFVLTFQTPSAATAMTFNVLQKHADNTVISVTDTPTLTVTPGASTSTTAPTSSTSTSLKARAATTTTQAAPAQKSSGKSAVKRVGQILVAIGVVIGITFYLRVRRIR